MIDNYVQHPTRIICLIKNKHEKAQANFVAAREHAQHSGIPSVSPTVFVPITDATVAVAKDDALPPLAPPRDEKRQDREHWQRAVDVLMAGIVGAVVCMQRNRTVDDERGEFRLR